MNLASLPRCAPSANAGNENEKGPRDVQHADLIANEVLSYFAALTGIFSSIMAVW
jgi:hypothetical protein